MIMYRNRFGISSDLNGNFIETIGIFDSIRLWFNLYRSNIPFLSANGAEMFNSLRESTAVVEDSKM